MYRAYVFSPLKWRRRYFYLHILSVWVLIFSSLHLINRTDHQISVRAMETGPVAIAFRDLLCYHRPTCLYEETLASTVPLSGFAKIIAEPQSTISPKPTPIVTASNQALPTLTPIPVVPTPDPTAVPAPADVDSLIQTYSQQYGVSAEMMKKIAKCESGFNPGAVNVPYGGMFQFLSSTWQSNRRAMGADPDPSLRFNAEEAIKTAAFKMSRDGTGAWPVCSRR